MRLKNIALNNFRNFSQASFTFDKGLTIIVGLNAVGKTNLLEAIYFVFKGCGFREDKEEELIKTDKALLSVEAETEEDDITNRYIVNLDHRLTSIKSYGINRIKKRLSEYVKQVLPVVIFSPSFLYVIDGNMQERRGFFDTIIEGMNDEYRRRRLSYEQVLRKRNKLIEKINDQTRLREQLPFWDESLIKDGQYISYQRQELVNFINQNPKLDKKTFSVQYLKNEISQARLNESFNKQLLIKKTLVGPQRDSFELYLDGKNIHRFGSRSQQRLALFWLAMAEIHLYEKQPAKQPLVLLDDVFSELDLVNKSLILKLIKNYQTVITTIEEGFVDQIDFPKTMIRL